METRKRELGQREVFLSWRGTGPTLFRGYFDRKKKKIVGLPIGT